MLALDRKICILAALEGESVTRLIIVIDGNHIPMLPSSVVAKCLKLEQRSVNHLADIGKLIACLAFNRWWIAEASVIAYPELVSWEQCGVLGLS